MQRKNIVMLALYLEARTHPLPALHPHGLYISRVFPTTGKMSRGLLGGCHLSPTSGLAYRRAQEDLSPWLLLFQASQLTKPQSSVRRAASPLLCQGPSMEFCFIFLSSLFLLYTHIQIQPPPPPQQEPTPTAEQAPLKLHAVL